MRLRIPGSLKARGGIMRKLLRQSYETIKEADPEAKIIIYAPGDISRNVVGSFLGCGVLERC